MPSTKPMPYSPKALTYQPHTSKIEEEIWTEERFCNKMKRKKRKFLILHRLVGASFQVGCHVDLALQKTNLWLWWVTSNLSIGIHNMKEKINWKVSTATSNFMTNESIIKEDVPPLAPPNSTLTVIESESVPAHSPEKKTLLITFYCKRFKWLNFVTGGLEIVDEGTLIFQIQSDDGKVDTIYIPQSSTCLDSNYLSYLPSIGPKQPSTTCHSNLE